MAEEKKEQPTTKIRIGAISIAGWKHSSDKGDWMSYEMQRSYKDGDEWKNTSSFRRDDIPKMVLALNLAYEEAFQKDGDSEKDKET